MRSLFTALALVGCSISVHSQSVRNVGMTQESHQNVSPLILGKPEQIAYKEYKPPGLRMRNTGRALTLIGGAMMLGGLIVYNNRDDDYYGYTGSGGSYYYTEDENEIYGQALFGVGMGMAIPGIICWTKGAKKYKRHLERETALRLGVNGFSLSYRF